MSNENATSAPVPTVMSYAAPIAGWLVPGLGHLIQRRYKRAALLFAAIVVMFFCGLGMKGRVYDFNLGDLLDMLGFVGDFGNGLLYFVARLVGWGDGSIFRATADYGTKYVVCSGLLNIIAAIDAHHIAIGKKH